MRRLQFLLVLLLSLSMVVGLADAAHAKSQHECRTTKGVGQNCITVTDAGRKAFRLRVEWKYDVARNVGVSRPGKRSLWEANILCKASVASVDTVRFYDERGAEIALTAAARQQVASGLNKNALPPLVKAICSA